MKTKILALLFLIAIVAVQGQFIAFAAEPPGIDSPFGDDDGPPSLGGDDNDIPTGTDSGSDYTSPDTADDADDADSADAGAGSADDAGAGSADDTGAGSADDTDADIGAGAGAQDDTSGSENIISESGPGVAFLLIPSLILGYAYRRKRKTSK